MIHTSFTIEKYKGINRVVLDLKNNRILTLVGLNESGKTTLMEAVDLFYKLIKGYEPTIQELNKMRPKGADFSGNIKISGTLSFEPDDITLIKAYWSNTLKKKGDIDLPETFTYTYEFNFQINTHKKTNRICIFASKKSNAKTQLVNSDNAAWQELIKFIKNNIVPEILYYDDFVFDIPERITFYKTGLPDTESADPTQQVWRSVLDDVVRTVNPEMTIQKQIADKLDIDVDGVDNLIDRMAVELNQKITDAWMQLYSHNNKINFKEISIVYSRIDNGVSLSFKIKTQTGQVFSLNERSKGFKWFFAFLLYTEFRKNRTKNILFLLDEPASNLASTAQAKLLTAIENLSDKSLVIYSTHSHHLINPKWLSGAYIVINEYLNQQNLSGDFNMKEGAKIFAMKYYDYVGKGLGSDKVSYFQPILDALEYQPSAVEPIPNIVILEGRNDWYTFKYFFEIILEIKDNINLYPGGGCDKLNNIISLYLAWGHKFLVILDGDKPGEKAKDAYIKDFGLYVKDKIFTYKDILGMEVVAEQLIAEEDKKMLHDSIFGTGSYDIVSQNAAKLKSSLNYAIAQLLIEKKKTEISDSTINNFLTVSKYILKLF